MESGSSNVPRVPASLEDQQSLVSACEEGDVLKVQRILQNGSASAVAADSRNGMTPLMVAAVAGHGAVIEHLVRKCGADPDRIDEHGCTALHRAAEEGQAAAVLSLLSVGASKDIETYEGCTAL